MFFVRGLQCGVGDWKAGKGGGETGTFTRIDTNQKQQVSQAETKTFFAIFAIFAVKMVPLKGRPRVRNPATGPLGGSV
jgi:hypothetical protein